MEKETRSIEDRMKERESEATEDGKAGRYTPGPWFIPEGFAQNVAAHSEDGAIKWVALTSGSKLIHYREQEANAHLIAAAPELLEALKILVESETVDRRDYKFAEHVINKAEGR